MPCGRGIAEVAGDGRTRRPVALDDAALDHALQYEQPLDRVGDLRHHAEDHRRRLRQRVGRSAEVVHAAPAHLGVARLVPELAEEVAAHRPGQLARVGERAPEHLDRLDLAVGVRVEEVPYDLAGRRAHLVHAVALPGRDVETAVARGRRERGSAWGRGVGCPSQLSLGAGRTARCGRRSAGPARAGPAKWARR